ncbi:type II toxin-antitoxin system VapB family antitoxin [Rhizobium sp. RU36D]|uniref:type II toxin-antitoxin system VapB family antitoxin n=1 Tax=Rhizobium sp. RU36D TaxID=1907415 RepID=UPI0009D80752|nr:type II toxin-antitoxin system VapB family antitoxin [Rhizobium sp. RU36D]SMD06891.1 antitoxin VapB [Rhizobium sp. RU36D]
MPLYVRDERVNELAEEVRKILKAPTKTEAIRQALERVMTENASEPTLAERLAKVREKYDLPQYADLETFDQKAYLDEMWGTDVS